MISRFFFLSSFHFFYCGGSAGHYHLPVLLRRATERCSHCPVFRTCTHFFVFFYDSSSSSSSFKKFDIKIKTSKAHNKSRVGRYLLLLSSLSLSPACSSSSRKRWRAGARPADSCVPKWWPNQSERDLGKRCKKSWRSVKEKRN